MPQYQFTCSEPYEFDDDDSSDYGHDIGWSENKVTFGAENDEEALKIVEEELKETIQVLGKAEKRKPISLVKIIKEW